MVPAVRRIKRVGVDCYWTMRGPLLAMSAVPAESRSVLFVCKGNICPSTFAERLDMKLYGCRACLGSAGLHVFPSIPSPSHAIKGSRCFGIDLESHLSQAISVSYQPSR